MSTRPSQLSESRPITVADRTSASARFPFEVMAMCAVMCVGGGLLSLAVFVGLGASRLLPQWPSLAVLIVVVNLCVAMTIYMALRGRGWRHSVRMNAVTVAVGLVIMGAIWIGLLGPQALPTWGEVFMIVCGPACVVMIIQMIVQHNKSQSARA